jgi:hypothetical protein
MANLREDIDLRKGILEICFDSYEEPISFASGEPANNKLDLERLSHNESLIGAVAVAAVTNLVRPHQPDLIVATPKGANWLARRVAWALGEKALLLEKDKISKEFSYGEHGQQSVEKSRRLVIVDDVLNHLTNTGKVYEMPGVAERTQAIIGVWDRNPDRVTDIQVPVEAVIKEEIPAMLPDDSPYWGYR